MQGSLLAWLQSSPAASSKRKKPSKSDSSQQQTTTPKKKKEERTQQQQVPEENGANEKSVAVDEEVQKDKDKEEVQLANQNNENENENETVSEFLALTCTSSTAVSTSSSSKACTSSPSVNSFFILRHSLGCSSSGGLRLGKAFYDQDVIALSKALLGKVLVRRLPKEGVEESEKWTRLSGRIVEVEAYLGGDDRASHSYGGKMTKKNKSMFMDPGTAYIYRIYSIHFCFNVSSRGEGAAVLVRGLEPLGGKAIMRTNRLAGKGRQSAMRDTELCSGPGKLCQALQLDVSYDGLDMLTHPELFLEDAKPVDEKQIEASARIGVEYAGEWAHKPYRFTIKGNPHVSRPVARAKEQKTGTK
jgi:DNA-3-methyladenine glycosylase